MGILTQLVLISDDNVIALLPGFDKALSATAQHNEHDETNLRCMISSTLDPVAIR